MRVGFVGTGAMGSAMIGHAARAGFDISAFDLDADARARARDAGAVAVDSLASLARSAEIVAVMVATDAQTRSVLCDLFDAGLPRGATIVVTATNHPRCMVELAALCAERGVRFVDAPVCYGLQGALAGDLISLCGGSTDDIARVTPLLLTWSRSVEHLGPVGAGQIGKTCNNMLHWAACVANYETLALARACGIDAQAMRETLLKCPGRNTTLERWDTSKFTWHEKDMDVALDLAQQAGLPLPLFGAVDQLVKRLGPDDVKALLHGGNPAYLGLPIPFGTFAPPE